MRISDWSSDVCSSDLDEPKLCDPTKAPNSISFGFSYPLCSQLGTRRSSATSTSSCRVEHNWQKRTAGLGRRRASGCFIIYWNSSRNFLERRSEEHTSELQSLMSISYAVLCLKKK